MKKIKLIAIIGKAGSGKNTLLSTFINTPQLWACDEEIEEYIEIYDTIQKAFNKQYNLVVPFTTRPQRPGEEEGKDYFFLNNTKVAELISDQQIVQCTTFNNWYYGFLKNTFFLDKLNIGIFNPKAVLDLKDNDLFDITTIYVEASDKERLMRQLKREDNPDVKEIVRRFSTDDYDFREEILAQMPNLNRVNNFDIDTNSTWHTMYVAREQFTNIIHIVKGKIV